jgi:hypothetical protein
LNNVFFFLAHKEATLLPGEQYKCKQPQRGSKEKKEEKTPPETTHLSLPNVLDNSCTWMLGNDWKMTVRNEDKSTGCSHSLSRLEETSWNLLQSSMDFIDHFSIGRNLRYSWDNRRHGARILARLDRFYLSGGEGNKPMIDEYRIRGDSGLSDHLPVSLYLTLKNCAQKSACYKMNASLLGRPEVKTEITRLWNNYHAETHFLVKFRRVICYYRRFC